MAKTRVTIVGCGFVGTALALAIRDLYKDIEIVGHDKNQANTQRAEKLKAIDRSSWNLPAACENAQLIVLAIPLDAVEQTLRAISPDIMPGAIVTDTCSTKAPIAAWVSKYMPAHASYISSDIIFNPAKVNPALEVESIKADTLRGAAWTLTPFPPSTPAAVDAFTSLVSATGAMPIFMDAAEHDGLRLSVDTVPAVLSSALMRAVTADNAWRERKWLAGAAFGAATTNVENIFAEELATALVSQREASAHWLNQIMLQLVELRDAVEEGRLERVTALLAGAREQREHWLADWHRGRDTGQTPADTKRPSLLGMFVGTKLASRMEERPDQKQSKR
jgi:prephenate dehydrogenase